MPCCKFLSFFQYPKLPSQKSDYPLARFWYADLELRRIMHDLDSFDGNKEPQRWVKSPCLINQFLTCISQFLQDYGHQLTQANFCFTWCDHDWPILSHAQLQYVVFEIFCSTYSKVNFADDILTVLQMSEADWETEKDAAESYGGRMDHCQDLCIGGNQSFSSLQVSSKFLFFLSILCFMFQMLLILLIYNFVKFSFNFTVYFHFIFVPSNLFTFISWPTFITLFYLPWICLVVLFFSWKIYALPSFRR